jgi:hypothetical protein
LSNTKEVQHETHEIRADTSQIRNDTEQILDQISQLLARLPAENLQKEEHNIMLGRYLEQLTSYADTVCGDLLSAENESVAGQNLDHFDELKIGSLPENSTDTREVHHDALDNSALEMIQQNLLYHDDKNHFDLSSPSPAHVPALDHAINSTTSRYKTRHGRQETNYAQTQNKTRPSAVNKSFSAPHRKRIDSANNTLSEQQVLIQTDRANIEGYKPTPGESFTDGLTHSAKLIFNDVQMTISGKITPSYVRVWRQPLQSRGQLHSVAEMQDSFIISHGGEFAFQFLSNGFRQRFITHGHSNGLLWKSKRTACTASFRMFVLPSHIVMVSLCNHNDNNDIPDIRQLQRVNSDQQHENIESWSASKFSWSASKFWKSRTLPALNDIEIFRWNSQNLILLVYDTILFITPFPIKQDLDTASADRSVKCAVYIPNSSYIATGSDRGVLDLWHISSHGIGIYLTHKRRIAVAKLGEYVLELIATSFDESGKIACRISDGEIHACILDGDNAKVVRVFASASPGTRRSIMGFSFDGSLFAFVSPEGMVFVETKTFTNIIATGFEWLEIRTFCFSVGARLLISSKNPSGEGDIMECYELTDGR